MQCSAYMPNTAFLNTPRISDINLSVLEKEFNFQIWE